MHQEVSPMEDRRRAARQRTRRLARLADRICTLIFASDYPDVDIAIERAKLREWVETEFPDKLDLYDLVYESRFDRLIAQFRPE
jgi:hypothetical protein